MYLVWCLFREVARGKAGVESGWSAVSGRVDHVFAGAAARYPHLPGGVAGRGGPVPVAADLSVGGPGGRVGPV